MKLSLLFKKENLKYIELEKELSKNELIMNVVDYGIINKNSIVDFYNKDENIQLHSYTVDYENRKFLFYEKINVLQNGKGAMIYDTYKSIEIFAVVD